MTNHGHRAYMITILNLKNLAMEAYFMIVTITYWQQFRRTREQDFTR